MKKTVLIALMVSCALILSTTLGEVIALNIVTIPHSPVKLGGLGAENKWSQTAISTSFTVGPQQSVRVLATSTARQWALLTATTTVPVFCNLSDASSTYPTGSGLVVHSTEPLVIGIDNLYIGSIQCSATASTTLFVSAQQ